MRDNRRRHEVVDSLLHGAVVATSVAVEPIPPSSMHAVGRFMTAAPHSIGRDQSLATAHTLMRRHGIRHLPVLEGGKLAGILSQRDLFFVEALGGIDLHAVKVEEAMSPDTYGVTQETPVEVVASEMAERKYGCAVVMDGARVVGVFTTTDALRVLADRLGPNAACGGRCAR